MIENALILTRTGYPRWPAAGRFGGARGVREATGSARTGTAGVAEPRNSPGMLQDLVLSLSIVLAITGPQSDRWHLVQQLIF